MLRRQERLVSVGVVLLSVVLTSQLLIQTDARKYHVRGVSSSRRSVTSKDDEAAVEGERDLQYYSDNAPIYSNYPPGGNDPSSPYYIGSTTSGYYPANYGNTGYYYGGDSGSSLGPPDTDDYGYSIPVLPTEPTEPTEPTDSRIEEETTDDGGGDGEEESNQEEPAAYYGNVGGGDTDDLENVGFVNVDDGGVQDTEEAGIDNASMEVEAGGFGDEETNEVDSNVEFTQEQSSFPNNNQFGAPEDSEGKSCPPMTCSEGTYLKTDCTCTFPDEDPCNACPEGTRCQRWPEPMCIDCSCGFCDNTGGSCCESDGAGSCLMSNSDCANPQNENFPAFLSTDDVCGGTETADKVLPYGCGCLLSNTEPCEYDVSLQSKFDDRCYICTTKDLIEGNCEECSECLQRCDSCITDGGSASLSGCLSNMAGSCRAQCLDACKKLPEDDLFTGLKIKMSSLGDSLEDIDIDEMLAKVGLTKAMVYGAMPFMALIAGGMCIGCMCGRRR